MARWTLTRDVALFVLGAAGLIHEIVVTDGERPWLLFLLGSILGLPTVLRLDQRPGIPAPPSAPPGTTPPAPPPHPGGPLEQQGSG